MSYSRTDNDNYDVNHIDSVIESYERVDYIVESLSFEIKSCERVGHIVENLSFKYEIDRPTVECLEIDRPTVECLEIDRPTVECLEIVYGSDSESYYTIESTCECGNQLSPSGDNLEKCPKCGKPL